MAKFATFDVSIEIKELKIHVKGDREIAPEIANNVAHQISSVLRPSGLLEASNDSQGGHHVVVEAQAAPSRKRRRVTAAKSAPSNGDGYGPVDWNHDGAKWGTPAQAWKQPQKVAWLLHVVEQEGVSKDGLNPSEMAAIFKAKFRAAGLLNRGNIARDLGNNPELFGSVDGRWFLKQAGREAGAKLVAEAKGEKPTA